MNYLRVSLAAVAALVTFFAWGFLTEGWLIRKDFAASAALPLIGHADEVHAVWDGGYTGGAAGGGVALCGLVQPAHLAL